MSEKPRRWYRKYLQEMAGEAYANASNTPGMGEVIMPTETTFGSGDKFDYPLNRRKRKPTTKTGPKSR